ncbi:MAG: T9SS type A sorting domain-containing protein [Bacteroidales bacterium]|nr:T9SS type A sorting domain-containing protein [Bacteroidales bacterium]
MKKLITKLFKAVALIALVLSFYSGQAQNNAPLAEGDFLLTIQNIVQTAPNVFEFDIYLLDADDTQPMQLATVQEGITFNTAILNGAPQTVGMTTVVPGSSGLPSGMEPNGANTLTPGLIKIAGRAAPGAGNGFIVPTVAPGVRVTTMRMTNSVPFTAGSTPNLAFTSSTATNPSYATRVAIYVGTTNTQLVVTPGVNANVLENPVLNPPVPVAFNVTGTGSYCQGSSGTPVGLDGSEVGVTYTLYKDAVAQVPTVAGTGFAITFGDQIAGTYTVDGTNTAGTVAMTGSAVITEDLPVTVNVSVAPDQNNICEGTSVTFTATPVNGGTPSYQWYVNGAEAGLDQDTFTYAPLNNDQVYVVMTSSLSCNTGNPVGSLATTMIVNPSLPVSVTASPDQNNICAGTSVTFTATPTNGGTPAYQWYLNGSATGLNQDTYTLTPVDGDMVYVEMTSDLAGCLTGNPAVSGTTTMIVNYNPVSVTIDADNTTVCQGTDVTFTATPVNGGNASYQWYLNGSTAGADQATYTFTPANGDAVYVILTSDLTCTGSTSPATSGTTTVTVNSPLPVSVTAMPDLNNVCAGTSVIFTATPTNGGTPTYQWYLNGAPAGLNQATYTFVPANNDEVYVVMTSDLSCVSGNPATSLTTVMIVNPLIPVSISATPDQNNVCEGTTITFTATPVNGGPAPIYQWFVNGSPVGANQDTYTFIANNNDQVIVGMLSNQPGCLTGNPAISDATTMVVYPPAVASVTIAPDQNNVCQGVSVTFTASPVNGGTTPSYQWYLNGSTTGADQATYTYAPNNGDQVYVVMTTSIPACITGSPATSNTSTMVVNPLLPVSVTAAPDQNNVCQGTSVMFTATPVNGGTPTYQWYRNSSPVGSNQATYTFVPNNGDQVYVMMTSNATCATGSPATSGTTTMVVNPLLPVSVTIAPDQNNVCQGVSVTFTASPVNGGTPVYQWYLNSAPVGSNQATYTFVPNNNDQVYVVLTSDATCATGSPATSAVTTMSVYPPLVASVSTSVDLNNVCQGTIVTFTATPVNGGTTPAYQWYRNGSTVGSNQPTYSFTPNNGDQVYVVMTSSISFCITGTPATSGTTTMVVNPLLPVSVTVAPDQNNICQGTTVVFTATPVNGGTPAYQWYRNGSPVGTNQATYTFIPNNNDQVYVVLTSNLTCTTGNPATSNTVTMITTPGAAAGVSIVAGSNDVCEGTEVVYTAFPVNGGTPSYQWKVNGQNAGTNSFSFSYFPEDEDEVYVVMTSSLTCVSNNPATSNTVEMIVNPTVAVTATIEVEENGLCAGEMMNFMAETSNGGNDPVYQWQVNGNNAGTNSPDYSYIPQDNDVVNLIFTSSLYCTVANPITSNSIEAMVYALPVVTWPSYEYPVLCINWPAVELSGGLPVGGVYSGQGVENNMFSPGEVGVGTYVLTYTFTDEFGCIGTAEYTVTVDECVGTVDIVPNASSFVLYPNPTSDRLYMKFNSQLELNTIRIINATGNVVIENIKASDISRSGIYVGQLSSGMYTLQAIFDNGIVNKVFVVR